MMHMLVLILIFMISLEVDRVSSASQMIRRIGIVGAGPSALTLASALKHMPLTSSSLRPNLVSIYEARSESLSSRLGGGLQLSGGAVVLQELGLLSKLQEVALPLTAVQCRASYSNGEKKDLFSLNIEQTIKNQLPKSQILLDEKKKPLTYTVMRDSLLQTLFACTQLPVADDINIMLSSNKQCQQIEEYTTDVGESKVRLIFADGSVEDELDLVVGADGIQSITRKYIEESANDPFSLSSLLSSVTFPTGLRITYFVSSPEEEKTSADSGTFQQYMGDGLYGLVGTYGGSNGIQKMLAIVYPESDVRKEFDGDVELLENVDWSQSTAIDSKAVTSRINRLGLQNDADVTKIIQSALKQGNNSEGRVFDLGVRDRSFLPLFTRWSSTSGRVLLMGDSIHAMAPFFGQGANQGMQDAYTIARLILKYNTYCTQEKEDVLSLSTGSDFRKFIAQPYANIRRVPTTLLSIKSNVLGRIETLGGPYGVAFKEIFFKVTSTLKVIEREFINGAIPKM